MLKFNKKALALGLAAFVVSGAAEASVMATSFIDMTNFEIQDSGGTQLDWSTDFQNITFTSTADQDITLGAGTDFSTNPGSITGIDFPVISLGTPPATIVNNVFPVVSGGAVANYAAADQVELGSPLANHTGFPNTGGAHVGNGSYVGLASGTIAGSANSNNNLNANWTFQLSQAGGILFDFDLRGYMEVFVSGDEVSPGFATAAQQITFSITDLTLGGVEVFSLQPALFNSSLSLNAPLPGDLALTGGHAFGVATAAHISALTGPLNNTSLYQLSARINTNVDASRVAVPEPGIALLMGAGLLGFGVTRIRRKRT